MSKPSDAAREILKTLIGFDTTSYKSNIALIHFIRDYLADHGIVSTLYEDETGQKANLYATIGPDDRPGIALSGHTDVVPVAGQDWRTDPFELTEGDDRVFGRGTCDMKGFIACTLAKVPAFSSAKLETPVHLAFSHDEEIGCVGVRSMLAGLDKLPVKPQGAIIGEPSDMKVIRGHKGKLSHRCHVRGLAAHSSLVEHGVNAIEYAARLINRLSETAERLKAEGPFDDGYDPPYTSVHTGTIEGGTQLNIIPQDCVFEFEFRNLPNEDAEAMLRDLQDYAENELAPAMRVRHPGAGFTWEPLSGFPGLDTPEDAEITQLAKQFAGSNSTGKVAFGTEAGLFSDHGIPAIICGPGGIEQAHKPDEFVTLEQLALCERFLDRLLERVSG